MNKLRYNVSFWLGALFLFVTGGCLDISMYVRNHRCSPTNFFLRKKVSATVDRSVQEIGFDLFVWAGNDLRVSRSLDTKL